MTIPAVVQFILILIGLALILFWLWMLVDLSNNEYLAGDSKNTWFLAFVLLNIFAALWYYYAEYRPRHL